MTCTEAARPGYPLPGRRIRGHPGGDAMTHTRHDAILGHASISVHDAVGEGVFGRYRGEIPLDPRFVDADDQQLVGATPFFRPLVANLLVIVSNAEQ